jgi:hypothetical protein
MVQRKKKYPNGLHLWSSEKKSAKTGSIFGPAEIKVLKRAPFLVQRKKAPKQAPFVRQRNGKWQKRCNFSQFKGKS